MEDKIEKRIKIYQIIILSTGIIFAISFILIIIKNGNLILGFVYLIASVVHFGSYYKIRQELKNNQEKK